MKRRNFPAALRNQYIGGAGTCPRKSSSAISISQPSIHGNTSPINSISSLVPFNLYPVRRQPMPTLQIYTAPPFRQRHSFTFNTFFIRSPTFASGVFRMSTHCSLIYAFAVLISRKYIQSIFFFGHKTCWNWKCTVMGWDKDIEPPSVIYLWINIIAKTNESPHGTRTITLAKSVLCTDASAEIAPINRLGLRVNNVSYLEERKNKKNKKKKKKSIYK